MMLKATKETNIKLEFGELSIIKIYKMSKKIRRPEEKKKPIKLWHHEEREKALETAKNAQSLPHLQNGKIKYLLKN